MLNFTHQTRVFLFLDPVDMRKSFRGLCQLAESQLQEDPASGHWFAFINPNYSRPTGRKRYPLRELLRI